MSLKGNSLSPGRIGSYIISRYNLKLYKGCFRGIPLKKNLHPIIDEHTLIDIWFLGSHVLEKERVDLMLELLKFGNNAMKIIETLAMLYIFS